MTLSELVCELQAEAHNGHAMYNVVVRDSNDNTYIPNGISLKHDHENELIEISVDNQG